MEDAKPRKNAPPANNARTGGAHVRWSDPLVMWGACSITPNERIHEASWVPPPAVCDVHPNMGAGWVKQLACSALQGVYFETASPSESPQTPGILRHLSDAIRTELQPCPSRKAAGERSRSFHVERCRLGGPSTLRTEWVSRSYECHDVPCSFMMFSPRVPGFQAPP